MKKHLLILVIISLLVSCQHNNPRQQTSAKNGISQSDSIAIITNPKSNLNIQTYRFSEIDSSGIFMFPLSTGESDRGSFSSKGMPEGYWNIIFFNGKTNNYHLLTDMKMLIRRYIYNYKSSSSYSSDEDRIIIGTSEYIFYLAVADDYNNDKKLNEEDPECLFASDKEGNNFRQISPTGYSVVNWEYVQSIHKILLTAQKDSNKDRRFNDEDETIAFEVDIDKGSAPKEIFTTEFRNKLKILFDRDWKELKE